MSGRWLRRLAVRPDRRARLLCFHHAGGSAAAFAGWPALLADDVETLAVQLPGREDRFAEPPYTAMAPLVTDLVDALAPVLAEPFACYGHSMGARVAFALARELTAQGHRGPEVLFVAGSPGPSLPVAVPGWDRTDDELVEYVRGTGGVPPAVLADRELLTTMLATIRADLTVVATWPYRPAPLRCPVRAFAGASDGYASPERMRAWRSETESSFALKVLPGGHFFPRDEPARLLAAVSHELRGALAPG